jgi:multicomponent Na+:H+ antiporter subunit F
VTEVLDAVSLALVAGALTLALWRVLREGSLPDKVIGTDLIVTILAAGVVAGAAITGTDAFLDVAVAVTLLGFGATVIVARFVERRGTRQ